MSKNLYEEAVADAQKLRELAEDTAKNKIIEAVMPQIRDMVNKRILGENLDDLEDDGVLTLDSEHDVGMPNLSPIEEEDDDYLEGHDDDQVDPKGTHLEIDAEGDVNIHLGESELNEKEFILDKKMSEALRRLITDDNILENGDIDQKVQSLESKVQKLSEVLKGINPHDLSKAQRKRLNLSFLHCVREAIKMRSELIITEDKTQERLELKMANIIKEIKNMSKPNRRNIFDFLFEVEGQKQSMEGLEEAELSLELTDEEQEELASAEDTESVGNALEDILADLEVSMDAAEEVESEEAPEEEEVEAEEAPEEELDLGEVDHIEEMDVDEVYEIDETMLRRELAKMMTENEAVEADPIAKHGGEVLGDVMLDIDEDDLINVLADEIGNTDIPSPPPMVAAESRRRARSRVSERKLAEARKINREYRQAISNLKGQLVEMNLFNAKLLYANKLMQNTNLSMKQQKAIVEALDNAKTLREAKLLYKSLTESLNRKSSKKLTEGSLRTLGSSSRSTRSAQPATNGVEVDRWGILAGLSSKD